MMSMKSKQTYLASIIVAFLLGVLSTYLYMTKKQMDRIMTARQSAPVENTISNIMDDNSIYNENADSPNDEPSSGAFKETPLNDSGLVSINDYSEEQAKAIVNQMPNVVLEQYVDRFMAKDASAVITDKRRFAERAIEELYQSNDTRALSGEVRLAYSPIMPAASIDTSAIKKNAKIYAHLDTQDRVPSSPYVFVKWVNNDTGQVLLFEKKDIVADSNENWVSFRPYDGWQAGSYDIRFYQFTSELQPIAQLTYHIYSVNEMAGDDQKVVNGASTTGTTVSLN